MIENLRIRLIVILFCLLQAQNCSSQAIVPFDQTTITSEWPNGPGGIAVLDNGRWVVTYRGKDTDGNGIFARVYDNDGSVYLSTFQVNTVDTGHQYYPSISAFSGSKFVITWTDNFAIINFQIYNADGTRNGVVVKASGDTNFLRQSKSVIATLSTGKFVIAWERQLSTTDADIIAQIFNADGTKSGTEFRVNAHTPDVQINPSISALTGKFIISWHSANQDGSGYGVYAQIYQNTGSISVPEFRVNTETANNQYYSAVAKLSTGQFVIAWQSYGQDNSGEGIFAKIFNDNGTPSGSEFQVNYDSTGDQIYPKIIPLPAAEFVISFRGTNPYRTTTRMFGADGLAIGKDFALDSIIYSSETAISLLPNGLILVVDALSPSGFTLVAKTFCPRQATLPFMYNGQCHTTCPSPAIKSYNNVCMATCPTGALYLYNDICYASCPSAASKSYNYNCYSTCPSEAPKLYGSKCYSTCPAGALYSSNQQCYATCPTVADKFYNYDCYANCPSQAPYIYGQQCYPTCPTAAPKFYNYDCYADCPVQAPLLYSLQCYGACPTVAPNLYNSNCYVTCPSEAPYLYNQQCHISCPIVAPFIYNYQCYMACPSEAPKVDNNICSKTLQMTVMAAQQEFASAAVAATSAMNASNSFFVLLASLSNMFLYVRYLRINYPDNIRVLFTEQDVELFSISLNFEIPNFIEDKLPQRPLPEVFEDYEVKSSFLNNLWGSLMTLAIMLAFTFLIILLEFLTRSCKKLNPVFGKLSSIAKWNMPLIVICGNYCDVIFYMSMEFRTTQFDSTASIWSFTACVAMLVISVLMLLLVFTIIRNIRLTKRNKRRRKNWNDYGLLYDEYKQDSYFTLGYLLFFFGRDTIFNLLIANVFEYPLIQTITLVFLSAGMVVYLTLARPFKSIIQFIQIFANEIMLLVLNTCILILAIFDAQNSEAIDHRNNIGEVLLIINLIFSSANLFFMFTGIFQSLYETYKKYKAAKAKNLKSFTQIVKYIFKSEPDLELQSKPKVSKNIRKSRLQGPSNLTHNTSFIKSNISDLSSSHLVSSHNISQNQNQRRILKRQPPKPYTSNSIMLDLSNSDIDINGNSRLSPDKDSKFDSYISKPTTIMNKVKNPRRDNFGNLNGRVLHQFPNSGPIYDEGVASRLKQVKHRDRNRGQELYRSESPKRIRSRKR